MISLHKLTKWLDANKPNNGLTDDQKEFLLWASQQDAEIDLDVMYEHFHPATEQNAEEAV